MMWQSWKTGRLRLHRKEDECIYKAQDQAEDRHLSAEMNTGAWRGRDNEESDNTHQAAQPAVH